MSDEQSFLFRWRLAIRASALSAPAKLVAHTLATHMNTEGGSCYPSLKTLSAESSLSGSTVCKAVKELQSPADPYIQKTRGGGAGRSTRYQAVIPKLSGRRRDNCAGDGAELSGSRTGGSQEEDIKEDKEHSRADAENGAAARRTKPKKGDPLSREAAEAIQTLVDAVPEGHADEKFFLTIHRTFGHLITAEGFLEAAASLSRKLDSGEWPDNAASFAMGILGSIAAGEHGPEYVIDQEGLRRSQEQAAATREPVTDEPLSALLERTLSPNAGVKPEAAK